MGKIVTLSENSLPLLRKELVENVESDKYEIGTESNPLVGGAYSHVDDGNVTENSEMEVASSDVDLSSFKKQKSLNPRIWVDDDTLDSAVRLRLLDIADDFWEYTNIKWVKPSGIILTGSICNFNWSSYSDIDLHLIVDFSEIDSKKEFVREYMDSKKNEWNDMHNMLEIRGYAVELYVQDVDEVAESNGVYDLESNEWIKKPSMDSIKPIRLNKYHIKGKAADIMTIIDDMYDALSSTDDKHKIDVIGGDAKYLWNKIKNIRKKSLDKYGESGNGNIIYKVLRREGYLDKLFDLFSITYDKVNSLDESSCIIKEYLDKNYNAPLVRYFKWASSASDKDKAEDLAYKVNWKISEYLENNGLLDEFTDEYGTDSDDDEIVNNFIEFIDKRSLCYDFIEYCQCNIDSSYWPSWMVEEYIGTVKNQWCIHFGSDSDSIANDGFTSGTYSMDELGYTRRSDNMGVGYDFAYLVDDGNVDLAKYGNEAVIFKTSGVLVYHYGDDERQVIFWGPYAHDFIPIKYDCDIGKWCVYGLKDQILCNGYPSDIAKWATDNLPQYKRQILYSKNGIVPQPTNRYSWDDDGKMHTTRSRRIPKSYNINYESLFRDKNIINMLTEEVVADGNSSHNPYAKRWKKERQLLKNFLCNYGKVMTSKENGKEYKVYYDDVLSKLIGVNYCICIQWDSVLMKPSSTIYVRALDKFTDRRFHANFDHSGKDNEYGTSDDN